MVNLCAGVVPRLDAKALSVELFHFLTVKRGLALSSLSEAIKVSPGPLVDQLWHKMLLETEVSLASLLCLSLNTI